MNNKRLFFLIILLTAYAANMHAGGLLSAPLEPLMQGIVEDAAEAAEGGSAAEGRSEAQPLNPFRYYAVKNSLPYRVVCITNAGKTTIEPDEFAARSYEATDWHEHEIDPYRLHRDMIIVVEVPTSRRPVYKIFLVPARYYRYSLHLKEIKPDGSLAVRIDDYRVEFFRYPSGGTCKKLSYDARKKKRRTIVIKDQAASAPTAFMLLYNTTAQAILIDTGDKKLIAGSDYAYPIKIKIPAKAFRIIERSLYRFNLLNVETSLLSTFHIKSPFFEAPDYAHDYREQVIVLHGEDPSSSDTKFHYSTHSLRTFNHSLDAVGLLGCGQLIRIAEAS